jgi:hypothetical protein
MNLVFFSGIGKILAEDFLCLGMGRPLLGKVTDKYPGGPIPPMDRNVILISSVAGALLISFPFLAILTYILLPFIISILTGTRAPCDYPPGSDSGVASSLAQLCGSAKTFLGISSMIGIILLPFIAALSPLIPSIDIFTSPKTGGEKVKWLAIVWAVPAIGPFLYYWFVKRKESIG